MDKTEAAENVAQAIERMMDAYGSGILRLCCLYLKDYALAEDAAQEAFLRAYRGMQSFRGQSSEKTWLTRIAINVCKNMLRNPWRRLRDWSAAQRLPEPICFPEARDGDVLRAVMGLGVKYREAVLLYYYQEMTVREIALLLNVPQATVATRLSRARARLKEVLKGWWWE